ncbi:MAG TPA: class I SAM-dependent methyltransferase [Actinomycetota bacterium]|nr:class I SAM-dependent methyltransferase [Actinomycetota bacterium]
MNGDVHPAAAEGFSAAAEEYERSRPSYPEEAVDRLVQELEITRDCLVLDLGAGTGKLTRLLAPTGARLVALDPVEAMRRACAKLVPEAMVLGGVAEALPFHDATFDGVVAGQAFHWFDGPRALAEIHRVLKPSGRLGLIWNVRDESVDWVRRLTEIIDPYERSTPREKTHQWRAAFQMTDLFGSLNQRRFPHSQTLDLDGLEERFASASFIASLPGEERAEVLGRIRELAGTHPDLAGRDSFELRYFTELYWCSRA